MGDACRAKIGYSLVCAAATEQKEEGGVVWLGMVGEEDAAIGDVRAGENPKSRKENKRAGGGGEKGDLINRFAIFDGGGELRDGARERRGCGDFPLGMSQLCPRNAEK